MLSRLATYTLLGIEAKPVEVEVDISPGALPKTILVGLAEAAVKESTHRIERALANSGYKRPMDADERLLNCICSSLAQSLSLLLSQPLCQALCQFGHAFAVLQILQCPVTVKVGRNII